MGKRVLLFILTNVLVIATISIVMNLLGIGPYLSERGINYTTLLVFCTLWGMGGAFISLAMSKFMAKSMMGVKIINPRTADPEAAQLVALVHRLAKAAKLPKMPEVGIYQSPEVNAFATGPSKSSSLVAVSSGLLERMSREEVEGVLGHEVAHIANGDMVTLTLIQGVVNAFTMFLARIVAYAIATATQDEEGEGFSFLTYFAVTIVLDILFSILGSMVVAYFSRVREFKADKGGATLAGRGNMVAALQRLKSNAQLEDNRAPAFQNFKISSKKAWLGLFSTHPPLEERIARLQKGA